MDERMITDLTRQVEAIGDRLAVIDGHLERLAASTVTADRLDVVAARSTEVASELRSLRDLDLGGRLLTVNETMSIQVNRLEGLGDQWVDLVNPQLKAARLRDLNQAVDRLTSRLTVAVVVLGILQVVLVLVALALG